MQLLGPLSTNSLEEREDSSITAKGDGSAKRKEKLVK